LGPSNDSLGEKAFIIKRALGNYYSEIVILRILKISGRLSLADNQVYIPFPGAEYQDSRLRPRHYLYRTNTRFIDTYDRQVKLGITAQKCVRLRLDQMSSY
jgi:hypothetical protein